MRPHSVAHDRGQSVNNPDARYAGVTKRVFVVDDPLLTAFAACTAVAEPLPLRLYVVSERPATAGRIRPMRAFGLRRRTMSNHTNTASNERGTTPRTGLDPT